MSTYIIVPKDNKLTVKESEMNIILNELMEIEIENDKQEKINNLLNKKISAFLTKREFQIINNEKRRFQKCVQCKNCKKCLSNKNGTFGHDIKCRKMKNTSKIKIDCIIKNTDEGVDGNVIKLNEKEIKYIENKNIIHEGNENERENENEWEQHEKNENEENKYKNKDMQTLYIVVPKSNNLTVKELEVNIILNKLKEIEISDYKKEKISNLLNKKISAFITQREFKIINNNEKRRFQKGVQYKNCKQCFSKNGAFGDDAKCRKMKNLNKIKIDCIIKNNNEDIDGNIIQLNENDIKYRINKENEKKNEGKEDDEGKDDKEEDDKKDGEEEKDDKKNGDEE